MVLSSMRTGRVMESLASCRPLQPQHLQLLEHQEHQAHQVALRSNTPKTSRRTGTKSGSMAISQVGRKLSRSMVLRSLKTDRAMVVLASEQAALVACRLVGSYL